MKVRALNDIVNVVDSVIPKSDIISYAAKHKESIKNLLVESPALLFRGFSPASVGDVCRIFSKPIEYMYGSTPRTRISEGVYSATEYPSQSEIPQHCEKAYQRAWPSLLFFQCDIVAESGGETPLSDMRKVTAAIPEGIKNKFLEKGVLYVRNYRPGLDVPWQTVFQTSDKGVVEAYCQENDMKFEWIDDDSLRTSQINQAMAVHPITKENIWFNQAHLFHVSNLEPVFRDFLTARYSLKELPRNTYYGDGEAIDVADLDIIRSAYEKYKMSFSWEKNDILIIDNMLCSHGRTPFKGDRKVFVSMG